MATNDGGFIGQDGLNAPDSPTDVSATAGDAEATISFTAPSDVGGSAITGYRAQSNDGIGGSGSSSPITVTGLTNGTSYTFNVWAINAFGWSGPSDASGSVTPVEPGIALFMAGDRSAIDYLLLDSGGNSTDFGDLTNTFSQTSAVSSGTRAVIGGGNYGGSVTNRMEYVTFAATGSGTDFGDLTVTRRGLASTSSSTRGVFATGRNSGGLDVNTMDYITIASTGNATDFGDTTTAREFAMGGASNGTRGVFFGGDSSNVIDYITIASTGNATNFGDLITNGDYSPAASNATRGLVMGGQGASGGLGRNTIEYITIASTGNSQDFGDLTQARRAGSAVADETRCFCGGGSDDGVDVNIIDFVTIASTGNASDFGDLVTAYDNGAGASNAHGGLS